MSRSAFGAGFIARWHLCLMVQMDEPVCEHKLISQQGMSACRLSQLYYFRKGVLRRLVGVGDASVFSSCVSLSPLGFLKVFSHFVYVLFYVVKVIVDFQVHLNPAYSQEVLLYCSLKLCAVSLRNWKDRPS